MMFSRFLILFFTLILLLTPNLLKAQTSTSRLDDVLSYRPDSALSLLRKEHSQAIERNDLNTAGRSMQLIGRICYNQGHYAQALDFYQHADKLFEELQDRNLIAANLGEMGILYYYNKQPEKSLSLYQKALQFYNEKRNFKGKAEILGQIGHLYEKQKRYDSAFYYQELAMQQCRKIGFDQGLAKIYENFGSIYEDQQQYAKAYQYFHSSLDLYQRYGQQTAAIEVINNLGDVLRKTNKVEEGLKMSYKALEMATKQSNLYQMASACRDLGKGYQLLGRMDSAYHYIELSRKYSLEVYSKDGIVQTSFLQVLYDINKKTNEINRLNNIRRVNRVIAIATVVVIALLLALAGMIISRQRLKIRDERALAERNRSIFEAQKELMELELKNKHLEEEALKQQLELKGRELSSHTLNLIKNNQLLENMRNSLQQMVKDDRRDHKKQMQQVINEINLSFNHEQHWKEFNQAFEQVHQAFLNNLRKYSQELTAADLRLIALLKVNMDSKDIAGLLGISPDSLRVARYRLRKKLNLDQGDNLSSFIQNL